jgi:outer membrane autotransporter protein
MVAVDRSYTKKWLLGSLILSGGFAALPSSAQAQIFCPPGFTFSNGFCNAPVPPGPPNQGFSVAGLSSEALSDVAQSLSQQTTTTTLEAVRERREQEVSACPANFESVRGECRPRSVRSERPTSAPSRPPRTSSPMVVKAVAPAAGISPGATPAVWTQVFGDFEKRDHLTPNALVDIGSKSTTWGVLSGFDFTLRSVATGGDVLVLGMLGGYTSSDIRFTNSSTVAHVTGPSVGAYGIYAVGAFSTDLTFKVDLFSLNESFSEVMNGTSGPIVNAGTASVDMTNFTVAQNFNYRIPVAAATWIEPTVGYRFTQTNYGAGAANLGFADGHDFRIQGGARLGTEYQWNGIVVTPIVTGLAYSDVDVTGGAASIGDFVNPTTFASDEGKVRGQGIFTINLDYLNGFSSFAQADVRGGQDFFGYGGRAGLRYQW